MTALSFTTKMAYEAGRKQTEMTTMIAVVKPSIVLKKKNSKTNDNNGGGSKVTVDRPKNTLSHEKTAYSTEALRRVERRHET